MRQGILLTMQHIPPDSSLSAEWLKTLDSVDTECRTPVTSLRLHARLGRSSFSTPWCAVQTHARDLFDPTLAPSASPAIPVDLRSSLVFDTGTPNLPDTRIQIQMTNSVSVDKSVSVSMVSVPAATGLDHLFSSKF